MPTTEATQNIASLFMKAVKNNDYSEIDSLSLDEMIAADIDLGARDRDSSYRLAIKKRIKKLEEAKKEEIRQVVYPSFCKFI